MPNHSKFVGVHSVNAYTTYRDDNAELRYLVIALDAKDEQGNQLFIKLTPERTAALRNIIDRALEGEPT